MNVGNGALQGTRQIDVEEGSVEAVHNNLLLAGLRAICLAVVDSLVDVTGSLAALTSDLSALRASDLEITVLLVLGVVHGILSIGSSTRSTAKLSDTENGLPALELLGVFGGVTETSRCKSSSSPAVVDVSKMPLNLLRRTVAIKLVTDIDEMLY